MKLLPDITLSAKSKKTADSLPSFFYPALNSLWNLHTRYGFRKPTLSMYRDEAIITLKNTDYSISVIHLIPDQVIFVDSRSPAAKRYSTSIRIPVGELVSRIPEFIGKNTQIFKVATASKTRNNNG
jgi:hypothetical protein